MGDFRVFCRPVEADPTELRLSRDESHHLVAVNRARSGDTVIAFDGRGTEWTTQLSVVSKTESVLRVQSSRRAPPLPHAITLAQALPKGGTMDDIVRQATELGTARIVPLETARTEVHLAGDRSDRKIEKWRVTALEAAKQCGNPWLPEILPIQSFATLIAATADHDLKLIASLHPGAQPLKLILAQHRAHSGRPLRRVLWLVGPEGDFSPEEMQAAIAAGFVPATLGPLVLRCDTAAIYALSVLSHEL